MTAQTGRVLEQLRRGPVTLVDFMSPAADGGPPIMRLGARIYDLRKQGHVIESRPVQTTGGAFVSEYRLVSVSPAAHNPPPLGNAGDDQRHPLPGAGTPEPQPSSPAPTSPLFEVQEAPTRTANHFDQEAA